MKVFRLLFWICGISMLPILLLGQSFNFTSQAQLNDFDPTLTSISGNIILDCFNCAGTIYDFSPLQNLTYIGGNLELRHLGATSLEGLDNLEHIGGRLKLEHVSQITNIDELSNLTTLGGIDIRQNFHLENIHALENIESLSGDLIFHINSNLTSFTGLNNLTSIDGSLNIGANNLISDLAPLSNLHFIGSNFRINAQNNLQSFAGLSNLDSIGGDITIIFNENLHNLNGLHNIEKINGHLLLSHNETLIDIQALNNIDTITDNLHIQNNSSLVYLDGLSGLTSIGSDLKVSNNPNLSVCCALLPILSNPNAIGGEITIENNDFHCNSELEIFDHCEINYFVNPPCLDASNGSISVQILTGAPPYQFTWQNTTSGETNTGMVGINNFTIPNLTEGIYNIIITDSENNEFTEEDIILTSIPGSIFEIIEITTTNSSNNFSNGAIHLNIAGGFPPYTYQWSGTSTGSQVGVNALNFSIQNIEAGEYTITVTDSNGSQQTISLTLLDEAVPVFPCTQALDIVILNDVSGSVDAIEYAESKQFFVDFLEVANIGTGDDESRAAIIEWSDDNAQSVQIPITDNIISLQNYINSSRAFSGDTAPHQAMTFGKNYLDTNARPDVEKVLILSTDGTSGQVSPSLIALSDQFKAEGYHIVTIAFDEAFSNITTREILRQVASIDLLAPGSPAYSQLDEDLAENIVNIYLCPIDPGSSATVYFERDGAIDIIDIEAIGGCPIPEFVELTFSVEALRELSVPSGMPVTFYYNNPAIFGATPILTWEVPCAIEAGTIDTFTVSLPVTTAANLFAVLNDDGVLQPPIQLPLTNIDELAYSNNVADTTLCGQALPTLQTFKYTTTPVPICNNTVIYQVDVCNISSLDATGVVIADDAPAGFVLVNTLVNDNGCSTANTSDFSIPAGCCVSITYIYDASAAANGNYDNQDVDISGITNQIYLDFDGYGTPAEDVLIDGTVDCPSTEINFTKSVNVDESCDDAFVVYTFTIDNQMNIPLNAVSFSDILPAPVTWAFQPYNLTGLSISNANINGNSAIFLIDEIAANTVASFSMDAALNDWTAAGSLDNTATLSDVLDLANGGLQTLSSNSVSTFVSVDSDMQIEWSANCAAVDLDAFLESAISDTWEWQTLGDGSFTDSLAANTIYTPGTQDLIDASFFILVKTQTICGEINETIEIIIEEPTPVPLEFAICEGSTIDYEDLILNIGDSMEFTFENYHGCDSIVAVSVVALANDATELVLETCEDIPVLYQNIELNQGEIQSFVFENHLGCDSTVLVSVIALSISEENLIFQSCKNEPVSYQDSLLNVGDEATFIFENYLGCDSIVFVSVEAGGGTEDIAFPNVFTPNGDGTNDCFRVVNLDDATFEYFDLQIFDRWGKLVFSTSNSADCWTGEINGEAAAADVYVYILKAETRDCEVEISEIGDLTLVR